MSNQQTIDLTPDSMKTPEGQKRVYDAMENLDNAKATCVNVFVHFMNTLERSDLPKILEEQGIDAEQAEDLVNDMQSAVDNLENKQNEFFKAVAGR